MLAALMAVDVLICAVEVGSVLELLLLRKMAGHLEVLAVSRTC